MHVGTFVMCVIDEYITTQFYESMDMLTTSWYALEEISSNLY